MPCYQPLISFNNLCKFVSIKVRLKVINFYVFHFYLLFLFISFRFIILCESFYYLNKQKNTTNFQFHKYSFIGTMCTKHIIIFMSRDLKHHGSVTFFLSLIHIAASIFFSPLDKTNHKYTNQIYIFKHSNLAHGIEK